jgi:hypothetical protein
VEEVPDNYRSCDKQKPKRLVAPEDAALIGAARLLVCLLFIRLDAEVNHGVCSGNARWPVTLAIHASV